MKTMMMAREREVPMVVGLCSLYYHSRRRRRRSLARYMQSAARALQDEYYSDVLWKIISRRRHARARAVIVFV